MPRKIITVTLNTSIDAVIEVPSLSDNAVINAESYRTIPAGKGINVARVLSALGEPVLVLGIVGADSKEFFTAVESANVRSDFAYAPGATRQNTTILQKSTHATTHIRTKGFRVDAAVIVKMGRKLSRHVAKNDIVVFSGSLPAGAEVDAFRSYIDLCKEKGAVVVVDTTGIPLLSAIGAIPHFIKPNLSELQTTFGLDTDGGEKEIIDQMKELVACGIGHVAVSLGPHGVLLMKQGVPTAWKGSLDLGNEYNHRKAVGSGDSMLAGFIYAMKRGFDCEEMVRWGVVCGAANVMATLPGDINLQTVQRLLKLVQLKQLPFKSGSND